MSMVRRHLWVSGRVQGVFFRQSTCQRAQQIGGLQGWVRNLSDGRVEALVQGPLEAVEALVRFCRHGPAGARVERLEQREEAPGEELGAFTVSD